MHKYVGNMYVRNHTEDGGISFNITYDPYEMVYRLQKTGSAVGNHTDQFLLTVGEFSLLGEYKREKMVFSLHQKILSRGSC